MRREIYDPARQRVPVRVWARAPPADALEQLVRLAGEPWAVDFVAGMADLHVAEGVAVGSVFATERTVVPRALGGDLGCGMAALRLSFAAGGRDAELLDRATLARLVDALDRAIPTGDAIHRGVGALVPDALLAAPLSTHALCRARDALCRRHLGTLGGGNHFLELDRDADGQVWLLVHSGSRGLGGAIAAHHLRVADAAREGGAGALAGLDAEAGAGAAYLGDLAFALAFARENRRALAQRATSVLAEVLQAELTIESIVELHHNFVARETWGGRPLWVHRKGAVHAPAGEAALIPGSMGTASYLVEGLGNPAAFGSCSHGAGRVLRRGEARAQVSPRALARAMKHVAYPEARARALVEEAPAAYREIGAVLEDQADLVVRRRRLEPLGVLKG